MGRIRVRDENGSPVIQMARNGNWETLLGTDTPDLNTVKHWIETLMPDQASAILADYEASKNA